MLFCLPTLIFRMPAAVLKAVLLYLDWFALSTLTTVTTLIDTIPLVAELFACVCVCVCGCVCGCVCKLPTNCLVEMSVEIGYRSAFFVCMYPITMTVMLSVSH